MYPTCKEFHLYDYHQSEEKKEEVLRGWGVDVSLGFLIDYFRETQNITLIGLFYKNWGFHLEGVWLWRISGGYSQEMMGFVSLGFRKFKSLSSKNTPEML